MRSSSATGVKQVGGDPGFLGFLSTSFDNINTSCRMVCISLETCGEQSQGLSGSCLCHSHSLNTSKGTTKHRTTPVTWAGKLSSTLKRALLTE